MAKPKQPRRAPKSSYEAFRDLMASRARAVARVDPTRRRLAFVVVATCTGSERMAQRFAMPMAFLDVTHDLDATLEALNANRHGGWRVASRTRTCFVLDDGWDDWRPTYVHTQMADGLELVRGATITRGMLALEHRATTPLAALRRAFAYTLSPTRVHEVASQPESLRSRGATGAPALIPPRYSALGQSAANRLERVDDVYAFDPWRDFGRMLGRAVSAIAGADADHAPGDGWSPSRG